MRVRNKPKEPRKGDTGRGQTHQSEMTAQAERAGGVNKQILRTENESASAA